MSKKLHLGILVDQLVPGGVQRSAIQEARELKQLGHKVTLFVLVRHLNEPRSHDLARGIRVVYLSDYNPVIFNYPLRIPYFTFLTTLHILNPFFVYRYRKALSQIDFLISHGTTTCITAQAITRQLKIPYMAFIYDPMIYILEKVYGATPIRYLFPILKPLIRWYERGFLFSAALVATQSKVHQDFLKREYHINPRVIYLGHALKALVKQGRKHYLLGYTRWELAKNPHFFIRLAKALPRTDIIIAGSWTSGHEKKLFADMIKKTGLAGRILLMPRAENNDLQEIASETIAWIHPHFEAFGLAGLEMAALGLPVILPKGSGLTELFTDGIHGYFPPNNESQFIKYIKHLVAHPKIAYKMGLQAAQEASKYTWSSHSQHVLNEIVTYLNKTKVVCLADGFVSAQSIGGGDRFLIELARRLPADFTMTIILPYAGLYHWQKALASNGIRYLVLPSTRFDNREQPIPLFLAYLIRCLQSTFLLNNLPKFDILHTATDLVPDTIPAFIFRKNYTQVFWAARFFHFIEPPLKRKGQLWVNIGSYILQQLSLKLLRSADLVMIDNESIRDSLVQKRIPEARIKLFSGGVGVDEMARVKPARQQFEGIYIGRLQPHKGVFDAIEVWSKVVKRLPHAKLVIIGYGAPDILAKLKLLIKAKRLTRNILITGYIEERETIFSYCKSAKLLLFLDHEAGFGLVVAEAMAQGLPVLAYNLPIFGNLYTRGFLTANISDTESVAQNAVNLLTQEKLLGTLAKQARQEALKFDWKNAARRFYGELRTQNKSRMGLRL